MNRKKDKINPAIISTLEEGSGPVDDSLKLENCALEGAFAPPSKKFPWTSYRVTALRLNPGMEPAWTIVAVEKGSVADLKAEVLKSLIGIIKTKNCVIAVEQKNLDDGSLVRLVNSTAAWSARLP